jgi:Family of unknown function (DUF5670)
VVRSAPGGGPDHEVGPLGASRAAAGAPDRRPVATKKADAMLETLIVILVVLWLLGLVTSYTLGGFIHVLLVIAVIVLVLRLVQGRRIA